jgi:hypothetical protein
MDGKGKLMRTESVQVRERSQEDPIQAWALVALMPVPMLLTVLAALTSIPSLDRGASLDFAVNLAQRVETFGLPAGLLMMLSVALAVWAYRRQRSFEARGAAAWATFVFLLGPLGVAAYLLHRSWPVQTDCERCGRPTPRNRGACLVCEQPFSSPEMVGVEIFA